MKKKRKWTQRRERGSMASFAGVFFVIIVVFIMMVATMSYTKASSFKIECDTIGRKALAYMEQNGCLPDDKKAEIAAELENLMREGTRQVVFVRDFAGTTPGQVAYGEEVHFVCVIQFENPLGILSRETHDANSGRDFVSDMLGTGIPGMVTYTIDMTSTAKW